MKNKFTLTCALLLCICPAFAQQTLSLQDCRDMAVQSSRELEQAAAKVKMAGYDRKIALANYFPNFTATGAYMYNEKNINLIGDSQSAALMGLGPKLQGGMQGAIQGLTQAIMSNPAAAQEYMTSPMWQTVLGALGKADLSEAIGGICKEIDDALHLDTHNVFVATVSVQQPVFVGGKIVAANRIARLAEELSQSAYDQKFQETLLAVDQAYWQVVSIAGKVRLAQSYVDLLENLENDVRISVEEGVSTESDALQIKVKSNEAKMMLTRATNGLSLAKMLLCKQVGLPLDSAIVLADENSELVPIPLAGPAKSMEDIFASRPELRSLDIAGEIYKKKVALARADMMPRIALTANYMYSNPTAFNGFANKWGGMFNAGVMVNIPIFHAFEALNKTRRARTEATLYQSQREDARGMVSLQVSQLRKSMEEASQRLSLAEDNLASAQENLRHATLGLEAGVINVNTAIAAHTAWLQAHTDCIDAGIELQMCASSLAKAEGSLGE